MGNPMSRMGRIALGAAILVALLAGPTAFVALWQSAPGKLPDELTKYQSLAGALTALFAAGLAGIGVWLNIAAQNANTSRQGETQRELSASQIGAQRLATERQLDAAEARARADRDEQRRVAGYERFLAQQQLASGFLGELGAILAVLHDRLPRTTFSQIAQYLRDTGKVMKFNLHVGVDLGVIFRANAGAIGLLPVPLPAMLAQFYGALLSFIERVNALDAIEEGKADANVLVYVFDQLEKDRTGIEANGKDLFNRLWAQQDELFSWPPVAPKLSPGQIANLAEAMERAKIDPLEAQSLISQDLSPEEILRRVSAKGGS